MHGFHSKVKVWGTGAGKGPNAISGLMQSTCSSLLPFISCTRNDAWPLSCQTWPVVGCPGRNQCYWLTKLSRLKTLQSTAFLYSARCCKGGFPNQHQQLQKIVTTFLLSLFQGVVLRCVASSAPSCLASNSAHLIQADVRVVNGWMIVAWC